MFIYIICIIICVLKSCQVYFSFGLNMFKRCFHCLIHCMLSFLQVKSPWLNHGTSCSPISWCRPVALAAPPAPIGYYRTCPLDTLKIGMIPEKYRKSPSNYAKIKPGSGPLSVVRARSQTFQRALVRLKVGNGVAEFRHFYGRSLGNGDSWHQGYKIWLVVWSIFSIYFECHPPTD